MTKLPDSTLCNHDAHDIGEPANTQAGCLLSVADYFDCSPVPVFAIDNNHQVMYWNKACEKMTGMARHAILGTDRHWQAFYPQKRPVLADLVISGDIETSGKQYYDATLQRSSLMTDAYEAEAFFPQLGQNGRWLLFSAAPLHDRTGTMVGAVEVLQDVTQKKTVEQDLYDVRLQLEELVAKRTAQLAQSNEKLEEDIRKRENAEAELLRRNNELTELNAKLSQTREQLLQSDKLASIGQLAAGVAHEINNPIGYIFSNFGSLESYIGKLFEMLEAYEAIEPSIMPADALAMVNEVRDRIELEFLKEDIPALMAESKEGIARVRKIVQDLKDFSRVDGDQEWQWANIHQGIDSTLNIVNNEVKYRADVIKHYGDIPEIECLPSQINQVIMNLVVNAAYAINGERGKITISTGIEGDSIWITVADNGAGIPKDIQARIFDPFFTTKLVGQGTGLGLSLSYGIVQKHNGSIVLESEAGRGTTFRITLPIRRSAVGEDQKNA